MSKHHRTCIECNKDFYGYGDKFCSHRCSVANRTKFLQTKLIRLEKTCQHCAVKFLVKSKYNRQQFCSTKCSRTNIKMYGTIHSTQLPPNKKYSRTAIQCRQRGLDICTKEEFLNWYKVSEKSCHYCFIPESEWGKIAGNKITMGKKWLTIDRKDNSRGYFTENMVFCCMRCNQVKNSCLTYEEMVEIGRKYILPKWQPQYVSECEI